MAKLTKKWTNPKDVSFEVSTTAETAFQRALFLSGGSEIEGIGFVRWLDLELPVDRERKGRGHCIDLIGRASDNSMVICELKFGKPGNGKPSEAQEQLEEYYHAVKENYDRLDEGNSLHHKNALNAGSFYWEEIASDSTIRIIAANDDYWNYWRKKDVLPAAGSKCYTVPVPTTLFKMQKEQCAKDRYTPSVSNLVWRFVK